MKMKDKIVFVLSVVCVILLVFAIVFIYNIIRGDNMFKKYDCCQCGASNGCCPCPNQEYIDEVSEWYGHKPSGAGAWDYMCREYKIAKNVSFDCFL